MSQQYLQSAFDAVCKEATRPNPGGYYVTMFEHTSRYGGPEEGGWWIHDTHVVAYQHYTTQEAADAALEAVQKLAKELEADATRAHGEQCLREMDWLDARGLDADWLPEPDGPSRFSVVITDRLPQSSYGPAHYE